MSSVISTDGLTKRFGGLTVVDDLCLEVVEGDLFGFLGPNGSGKSTTLRMLLGLVFPTSGQVEVLGRRMPQAAGDVLREVGAVVEGPGFYPHLSGRRNLVMMDGARREGTRRERNRRVGEALDFVGLDDVGRRPYKAYSLGMKQRLALGAALLRRPRLLVLDEPTNGLDPQGSADLRGLLRELVAGGTTVVLSSHLLGEVETLCNRAAIVSNGGIVAQDTVDRLMAPTGRVHLETPDRAAAQRALAQITDVRVEGTPPEVHGEEADGGGRWPDPNRAGGHFTVDLGPLAPEDLNRALVQMGVAVREMRIEHRTLEDLFLHLTSPPGAHHSEPGHASEGAADVR